MAQVQENTLPQVSESAQATPTQQIQAPPQAFAAQVAGQGLQEIGAAGQQVSSELHTYAQGLQKLYTDQLADSKGLQAAAEGAAFTAKWKENNTLGNAVANYDAYQKGMEDIRTKARDGLGVYGSQMFDQLSRRYMVSDLTSTANYVASQGHENIVKTAGANVTTAGQLYVANPTPENLQLVAEQVAKSTAQVMQSSSVAPDDPLYKQQMHEYISPILRDAIESKYQSGDLTGAQQLFAQQRDSMLPNDQRVVGQYLRTASQANDTMSLAHSIIDGGAWTPHASLNAQDPHSVFMNGIIPAESGGLPNGGAGAVGKPTQFGTAYGASQMLDGTGEAMAKKLGVAWDPTLMRAKTPEGLAYQEKLGEAYFQEGLDKYGGDVHKALEYYHGGPDESQWGPKTQGYADAIMAKITGSNHTAVTFTPLAPPTLATDPNQYMATAETQARQAAQAALPNDPVRQDQVVKAAVDYARSKIAPVAAQQKADFDTIGNWIMTNSVGDPSAIAAQFPGQWSSMRPEYQKSLQEMTQFENRVLTPEKINTIYKLEGEAANAATDPNHTFLNTDVRSLNLPFEQQQRFWKMQQQIGQNIKSVDQTTAQALTSYEGRTAVTSMKLKPGTDEYNQFAGVLHGEIEAYRTKNNGTAPQGQDLAKLITAATSKAGGLFGMGATPGYKTQVPETEVPKIKEAWANHGVPNPTPQQITALYLGLHGASQ